MLTGHLTWHYYLCEGLIWRGANPHRRSSTFSADLLACAEDKLPDRDHGRTLAI